MSDLSMELAASVALADRMGRPLAHSSSVWISFHHVAVHGDQPTIDALRRYARRRLAGEFDRRPAGFAASSVELVEFDAAELTGCARAHGETGPLGFPAHICTMVAYHEPS